MCIAILNKKVELSHESLRNCWDSNHNGAGLMWTDGASLHRFVSLNSFQDYYDHYVAVRKLTELPILLHFRISTGGKVDDTNAHPFYVPGTNWGLIHNGIISIEATKDYSDTYFFANHFVPQFKNPQHYAARMMMEDFVGSYNKVVFLNTSGEYFFLHENKGHWDEAKDTWYSNDSYKEKEWMYYGHHKVARGTTAGAFGRSYDKASYTDHDDDYKYLKWQEDRGGASTTGFRSQEAAEEEETFEGYRDTVDNLREGAIERCPVCEEWAAQEDDTVQVSMQDGTTVPGIWCHSCYDYVNLDEGTAELAPNDAYKIVSLKNQEIQAAITEGAQRAAKADALAVESGKKFLGQAAASEERRKAVKDGEAKTGWPAVFEQVGAGM